jgi:hypothetical protein
VASAKAHEEPSLTCVTDIAMQATLTRANTWSGTLEIRFEGIHLLTLIVLITVIATLTLARWRSSPSGVPDQPSAQRATRATTDEKLQAVKMLVEDDFYVTPAGHRLHLSLGCESVPNPVTARPFKFCQLCTGIAQARGRGRNLHVSGGD